jgi:hypothetical protein
MDLQGEKAIERIVIVNITKIFIVMKGAVMGNMWLLMEASDAQP